MGKLNNVILIILFFAVIIAFLLGALFLGIKFGTQGIERESGATAVVGVQNGHN